MSRFLVAILIAMLAVPLGTATLSMAATGDAELGAWRTERRARMRGGAEKSAAATFNLLVIPVDFQDERLPDTWSPYTDLESRLAATDRESLLDYFRIASRGRLDLRLVLAPLVSLSESVVDYSDLGLSGPYNARRMVAEALVAVRDAGVDFAFADNDGPDGIAGSGDDDGEVDGVLVLHAAPGLETDLENGLIAPHQFYIIDPVVDQGTSARYYAIASLEAGLGVWIHETAHLFGLEDRYDTIPSSAFDISTGGLGDFSLMASGAWGRGDGSGAALLDAYSALQLGWVESRLKVGASADIDHLAHTLESGLVWKMVVPQSEGREYYLLETRGRRAGDRYDAAVPTNQLIVYHIDETVPDDGQSSFIPELRHLRVALFEADGDGALARREDSGSAADLFPGSLDVTAFGGDAALSSTGYDGGEGPVLSSITSVSDGVNCRWRGSGALATAELHFRADSDTTLAMRVISLGDPILPPEIRIFTAENSFQWGHFADYPKVLRLEMASKDGGFKWETLETPTWIPNPDLPPGAVTTLVFDIVIDGAPYTQTRDWLWRENDDPLDFAIHWPQGWEIIDNGAPAATWQRWVAGGDPLASGAYLACSETSATGAAAWPDLSYGKNVDVSLVSPYVQAGDRALRLLHAVDSHVYESGLATDGALVEYLDAGGNWRALEPIGSYPTRIVSTVLNPAAGRPCFGGAMVLDDSQRPFWTESLFEMPADDVLPWTRLRFRFVSDSLWGARGWLIAGMRMLPRSAVHPFAPTVDRKAGQLDWIWPALSGDRYEIQKSLNAGRSWTTIWTDNPAASPGEAMSLPLGVLDLGSEKSRTTLRVVIESDIGSVVSATTAVLDGFPVQPVLQIGPLNPPISPAMELKLPLFVPTASRDARLSLHDLRGRQLREWPLSGGSTLLIWDYRDQQGRALPSGLFILRLQSSGAVVSRKVVLLK